MSVSQFGAGRSGAHENERLWVAERAAVADGVVVKPVGFGEYHAVWGLPWISPFTNVPPEGSWPRLMSPPHPAAVGSYGERFAECAEEPDGAAARRRSSR